MKLRRFFALMLALCLSVSVLSACDSVENYTAKNKEYVIGLSAPLSGDTSAYGQAVKNGAQLAVDEINEAGGLNGIEFKLVVKDDKNDDAKLSGIYKSLMQSGMQLSLGTVTTGPALKFRDLSAKDHVFFLTPSASGDDVISKSNGYQMCFADGNQGQVAAEFVNESFAGQTIGVFYKSDENYSKGIYEQFRKHLDASVQVIETSFTEVTATNFTEQIEQLKDCRFVFMPVYYTPASKFMTQAKDVLKRDAVYFGCDGFDGIDRLEGFDMNAIPQKVTMLSHFDTQSAEGRTAEFISKYMPVYGMDTLNQFSASAYDCVYALYGAMQAALDSGKKIPVTISASQLCKILKEQFDGGYTYENAVTGIPGQSVSWESTGHVSKEAVQHTIKDFGEIVE